MHRLRSRGCVKQTAPATSIAVLLHIWRQGLEFNSSAVILDNGGSRLVMSRLIVVSNRVSAVADSSGGATGGLTMALSAALRESSGIWFGWSGETTDQFTGHLAVRKAAGVTVALIDLEEQDRQEYYNGYANRT